MKLIAPDYYGRFACLMGACRHSCCVGWEIDIDADSLARYRAANGPFGERLRKNLVETDEGAYFAMTSDGRCPFLRADGLCDMILLAGEDSLCQICADHPRFRNFYSDRTEIGLGLCCEAAAQLVLGQQAPMQLVILSDDGADNDSDPEEAGLLSLRDRLISLAQDRTRTFDERITALLAPFDVSPEELLHDDWIPFLLNLERLDDAWADRLTALSQSGAFVYSEPHFLAAALEQLLVYLLYRHLPGALDDGDTRGRILYSVLITLLIRRLCAVHAAVHGSLLPEHLSELARMYSSEIEYSDENLCAILDYIAETLP